jgi:hypothetical protein
MTKPAHNTRRFRVQARHIDGHHARLLDETSFEAAAVAYLEHFDGLVPQGDDDLISVIVHEVETGHEHCFRVDLGSGETIPCG